MRVLAIASAFLMLAGCGSPHREEASKCGVTKDQLRQAIDEVSGMTPYDGKRVGQCDLIVDEGRNVAVITPEIEKQVEEMVAREKAESKK